MRTVILISFCGLLLLVAGCGSSSSNMAMNPTPTPTPGSSSPAPSPTPTPSATPTPSPSPTPTPTPTAQSDAFLATWFFIPGRNIAPQGTITIDTNANNGEGNLDATMTTNNATFTLQFCPYPQGGSNCTNITSFNPGTSFVANVNFTFPMKGTFSGAFQIVDSTGDPTEATGMVNTTGLGFKSALLPAATITGGIGQTTGNSPGSGTDSMNGTTAHITLNGALPNHTFSTALCNIAKQCTTLADITTDAQGNASSDVGTMQQGGFSVFQVSDASGVQFVSAFRVQ